MDGCSSFREIDPDEYHLDLKRVRTIGESWGVCITAEGKVRIPVCSYDDVLPLLRKQTRE